MPHDRVLRRFLEAASSVIITFHETCLDPYRRIAGASFAIGYQVQSTAIAQF